MPSVPSPAPSKIAPTAGPVSPCSASTAARCAWWCWTATCSTPSRAERVARRQVVRVQVVRDDRGRHREQPLEVVDPGAVRRERLPVLEVADVVADPRAAALGEAERALELGAARQDRRGRHDRQREAVRHAPARAAQDERAAHDRVVGARLDRPVVDEEGVGDPAEPLARVVVGERDRLVGDVAARQHERHAHVAEQQMVQRRVRQHHAELAQPRGDRVRHRGARRARGDDDRPVARGQPRGGGRVERDERARRVEPAGHQRERPLLAPLAGAQRGDRRLGVRAAGQVVAADPLDRDDRAGAQQRRGGRHGVAAGIGPRRAPAARAGRTPGTRSARRGSGGRAGPRTPPGSGRTSRSRPSSCARGRTARRARS